MNRTDNPSNFEVFLEEKSSYVPGVFFKKGLELHIISSGAVLKNYISVAVGIELPAFGGKGK